MTATSTLEQKRKAVEYERIKETEAVAREKRQANFGLFVQHVRPDIIIGRHHKLMAEKFEQIAQGKLKRLMIFMPPGHTKSLFGSILFPLWFIGKFPEKRILHISHTAELVQGFGREIRDLMQTHECREVFPDVELRQDSKAVGRWQTTKGGIYTAAGVGGAIAGKRGEIGIIDDPVSEQDAYSESAGQRFAEWYPGGFRTRLMPGAPIIWIQTRWTYNDPAGWLLEQAQKDKHKEPWDVIELPAILDQKAASILGQGAKAGEALFPELWPLEELESIRDSGMPESQWESLYLQRPKPQEGGILKRAWWKKWTTNALPPAKAYFASWDTAFSERDHRNSAYSACTWWQVFYSEELQRDALLLLGRWYSQAGYPELRQKALQLHKDLGVELTHLIERKASGQSLIQDLRKTRRLRVIGYDPKPDGDKVARAYLASPALKAGLVYMPERKWADELVDMVAAFPLGPPLTKDLTDTVTQAIQFLNRRWYLNHPDDDIELDFEPPPVRHRESQGIYG